MTTSFSFLQCIDGFWYFQLNNPDYSIITANNYKSILLRICKQLENPPLESLTRNTLLSYFGKLKLNGFSNGTIQAHWRTLRSFYNWAEKEFDILRPDDIPMPNYEPAVILPFTPEECGKMYKYAKNLRDKAIVLFLLDTGIRVGELSRLCVGDVDLQINQVVIKSYSTDIKSKPRIVHIGNNSRTVLWKYLASRGDIKKSDPLFSTNDNRILARYAYNNMFKRLEKKSGVINIHPHRFRHTFAIMWIRNSGDVFTLQSILGHKTLKQSRDYAYLASNDIALAHNRASPVDNMRLR